MDNMNWFFNGLFGNKNKEYEDELNRLYFIDPPRYLDLLNKVKHSGYKVMRNGKGQHRVEVII